MLSQQTAAYKKLLTGHLKFCVDVPELVQVPLCAEADDDIAENMETVAPGCGTVKTNDCTCRPQCHETQSVERSDRLA